MKQTITIEKQKREIKNECLNFKNVSLMKKQIFTLMMLLALMVGFGSRALAQNESGLTPDAARLAIVGSIGTFTTTNQSPVGPSQQTATYQWNVYEIAIVDGIQATGADVVGTKCRFMTDAGAVGGDTDDENPIAYIQWTGVPADDEHVFAVEITSTTSTVDEGTCTTRRRVYVTVFDYQLDVFLSDAAGTRVESGDPAVEAPVDICNSWSGLVLYNDEATDLFEGDRIILPDHAETHNGAATAAGGIEKTTSTYFTIRLTVTGAAALEINDLNLRLRLSMPLESGISLYQIERIAGAENVIRFENLDAATDNDVITGAEVLTFSEGDFSSQLNSHIYILPGGAATNAANYVFEVRTHNNLGSPHMAYDVRIDEAQLALQLAGANAVYAEFNDGRKIHNDLFTVGGPEQTFTDGRSELTTINQSPATSTIGITD
jgi:hypothetical protein